MGKVAAAGRTGGVGHAIVDAPKEQSQHEFILLSRNDNPTFATENNLNVVKINYSDVAPISKVLDEHNIHTVISAFYIVSQEHGDSQVNPVLAAVTFKSVKLFVTSEYRSNYEEKHVLTRPTTALKAVAITEFSKTDLEYTSFVNGLFLNYLAMPVVPSRLAAGVNFDISNKVAVAIGEMFTLTENAATVIKGQVIEAPAHRTAYSVSIKEYDDWFEVRAFSFDVKVLNSVYLNELFPEMVPLTVEDGMRAQVQLSEKSASA